MIKGLAITPPVIGRISIGHLVQKGEKWVPEKDDSFTLTTQVQGRNGWVLHPLHQQYSEQAANGKLRAIPVRLHIPTHGDRSITSQADHFLPSMGNHDRHPCYW